MAESDTKSDTKVPLDLPHILAGTAVVVSVLGGGYSGLTATNTKSDVQDLRNLVVENARLLANQQQVMSQVDDFRRRISYLERRLPSVPTDPHSNGR